MSKAIADRLEVIRSKAGFDGPHLWLTFYVGGSPQALVVLASELDKLGAANLADAEAGFFYPKLHVENSSRAIMELIDRVRDLAIQHSVDVVAVDADTSSDVTTSKFAEIINYRATG